MGFEPTIRYARMPDFESGAFDHSATSPSTWSKRRRDYSGSGLCFARGQTKTNYFLWQIHRITRNVQLVCVIYITLVAIVHNGRLQSDVHSRCLLGARCADAWYVPTCRVALVNVVEWRKLEKVVGKKLNN